MKKKGIILALKKYFKKRGAVFSGGVLVIAIIATVFFASGGINNLSRKLWTKAQSPLFYFPNFPTRLALLTSEIAVLGKELTVINEELSELVNTADCQNAQSQCKQIVDGSGGTTCTPGPIKIFGSPYQGKRGGDEEDEEEDEPTIEMKQRSINDRKLRLVALQEVLKGELEFGLEKQLRTLRPEDAQLLRENLQKLNELVPEMISLVEINSSLPNECSIQNCTPDCGLGQSFTAQACIGASGQQKPIEFKFKVGVSLDNMHLGEVGIKSVNLSLPDKINVPQLNLPSLSFRLPSITLNCPAEHQSITLTPPSPSPPSLPTLTLSCPTYPGYSSYQCSSSASSLGEEKFLALEWWNQTFEHLSGECLKVVQKSAEIDGWLNNPEGQENYQGLIKSCLLPSEVVQTTLDQCEARWTWGVIPGVGWDWGILGNGNFEVCRQIGHLKGGGLMFGYSPGYISPERKNKRIEWCKKLFQEEGETPPDDCVSKPLLTTKQKCDEIRDSGRENVPLSCKLLPLFAGKLEDPPAGTITLGGESCPAENIGDYPSSPITGCALALPSVPKISFPTIVIPDLKLPTFSLRPLIKVKLPSFIFEDLKIPDIELCNLDSCRFQFPNLSFRPPSLRIPKVDLPPITLEVPGIPPVDIQMEPISFQPLTFNLPQLINLSNLVTPELKLPTISLPEPKLQFAFSGINIDLLNLLLGLFKIPSFNACVAVDAKLGVLNISLPDRYFYWPKFPRVPEIPFCQDVRTFCQNAQDSIREITNKQRQIEDIINAEFQNEIQERLDKVAKRLSQRITEKAEKHLEEVKNAISEQLLAHLGKYAPQNVIPPSPPVPGVWRVVGEISCQGIPPLNISLPPELENFTIEAISIDEFMQEEFGTGWPSQISIPWPASLKKLDLNKALSYPLPDIPLSGLSYSKEINERLPGLQVSAKASFDLLSGLRSARSCQSLPPQGGNPCQNEAGEIEANLNRIQELEVKIKNASEKITNLLY